jgi:hypothetical protein
MRKRTSTRTETYGSVVLYRDDFTELLDLLNSYVFSVTLSDEEYEYENLDELQNKRGEVIRHVQVTGHGSESTLILEIPSTARGARLEVIHSDEAFLNIQDFVKKHRRIALAYLLATLSVFATINLIATMLFTKRLRWSLPSAALLLISVILLRGWYGGLYSRIYLTNRHQVKSFWARNKDKIWLLLIGAIIGAIVSNIPQLLSLFR